MNASIRTPLYIRHQNAADLGSWSVARDVAWDRVPALTSDGSTLPVNGLRDACLIEAVQLVTLGRLAADLAPQVDASIALAIVLQESAKHFHALRLYLDTSRARPRLTDAEIADARASVTSLPSRLEPIGASVGLLKAVHMASHFYRTLASRSQEPVLRDLLRLIAADKVRHGRMAADVLESWVESDRSLAPRVKDAAEHVSAFAGDQTELQSRGGWPTSEHAPLRSLVMRLERICAPTSNFDFGQIRLDPPTLAAV